MPICASSPPRRRRRATWKASRPATSAKLGPAWMDWHLRAGYLMAALILFRLVWGFCGSQTARFGAFLKGPQTVVAYLRALALRTPTPHAGHNPAGARMVVAMLATLAGVSITGLFADDLIACAGADRLAPRGHRSLRPGAGTKPDAGHDRIRQLRSARQAAGPHRRQRDCADYFFNGCTRDVGACVYESLHLKSAGAGTFFRSCAIHHYDDRARPSAHQEFCAARLPSSAPA